MAKKTDRPTRDEIVRLLKEGILSKADIARTVGVSKPTVFNIAAEEGLLDRDIKVKGNQDNVFRVKGDKAFSSIVVDKPIKTLNDLIKAAEIDQKVWHIDSWECSAWTVPLKIGGGQEKDTHRWKSKKAIQTQQYKVSIDLSRKLPELTSVEAIIADIKGNKFKLPAYTKLNVNKAQRRRALEISIVDLHLGMKCYKPQADHTWSIEEAEQAFMATTERLIELALPYGPFEKIVVPIGNDFLHVDTLHHNTTGGTSMTEAESIHEAYYRGRMLYLWYTERLRKIAPLDIISIPGNHDRLLSFTMAQLIDAFYQGAKATDVKVFPDASPYKYWNYGVTLIGFEHGHSAKPIRLASIMANENPEHWPTSKYREWHLGDQHRKGSGKPSMFEEQGVSIEYLPGLTPPNEWHRLKGFNWQKRGGMGFVYDYDGGLIARLQCNFDSTTGKPMWGKK